MYQRPNEWQPKGISYLEEAAISAVKETGCISVIAGPGAGKTEFLAQRAGFLLQTGICRRPYRILAISFKKDAAQNLKKRVKKRCNQQQANRFDSMTFDAFTKGLVDRFLPVIPKEFRPNKDYQIMFFPLAKRREMFRQIIRNAPKEWVREIASLSLDDFESHHLGTLKLELGHKVSTAIEFAVYEWWKICFSGVKAELSFTMINRLAELILRTNKEISSAIISTYPFVFIDEFQDTTYAQYDLIVSLFGKKKTSITAVGDDKQRIMTWAGAVPDAFANFEKIFGAKKILLKSNFRSSPRLTEIQQVIAKAMDPAVAKVDSKAPQIVTSNVAEVWIFKDAASESKKVAEWLAQDISVRHNLPRDYALLVRQTADKVEENLQPEFEKNHLKLRNENRSVGNMTLQDLLAEELCRIVISIFRLALSKRQATEWSLVSAAVLKIRQIEPEDVIGCRKVEDDLIKFIKKLSSFLQRASPHKKYVTQALGEILKFLSSKSIKRAYSEYGIKDRLENTIQSLDEYLGHCTIGNTTWIASVDKFEGKDSIPLMTVHKSKGLEYDSIIFIGLDDKNWWSHSPGGYEGMATFFVALSRAKQKAIFTFCEERGPRDRIKDIYTLLKEANVLETQHTV